jgi:hypothetical protein
MLERDGNVAGIAADHQIRGVGVQWCRTSPAC